MVIPSLPYAAAEVPAASLDGYSEEVEPVADPWAYTPGHEALLPHSPESGTDTPIYEEPVDTADAAEEMPSHLRPIVFASKEEMIGRQTNLVITAGTSGELHDALIEVYLQYDMSPDKPTGTKTLAESVAETAEHEEAHRRAALGLDTKGTLDGSFGATAKHMGADGVPVLEAYFAAAGLETTEIGRAVMAAAPERPSEADMEVVRALGHCNVEEVAEVAKDVS